MIAAKTDVKVAVVSDRPEFCKKARAVLSNLGKFDDIIEIAHCNLVGFPRTPELALVLCDLDTDCDDVIPAAIYLKEIHDLSNTLFLMASDDNTKTKSRLHVLSRIGSVSCISSDCSDVILTDSINRILKGERVVDHQIRDILLPVDDTEASDSDDNGLSAISLRQIQVLSMIASGMTVHQVAGTLHLSPRTIESHKYQMMKLLDCACVVSLCRFAIRHGLLMP